MRDDTECEKCTGREKPAIIAASILVPIVLVGVPLLVLRIERTRAVAYKIYNRYVDVGKLKVVFVNYAVMASISWNLEIDFPQPFKTLEDIFSVLELSLLRLMPLGCLAPFDFISDFYFISFTPLALLVLIVVTGMARISFNRDSADRVKSQHTFAALLLSFLVLPAASSKVSHIVPFVSRLL